MANQPFSSTNLFGPAIKGNSETDIGVLGVSVSSTGVEGFSTDGAGLLGTSVTQSGLQGYSNTGTAGYFQSNFGRGLDIEAFNGLGMTVVANGADIFHASNSSSIVFRIAESGALTITSIFANGINGNPGDTLHTDGANLYWSAGSDGFNSPAVANDDSGNPTQLSVGSTFVFMPDSDQTGYLQLPPATKDAYVQLIRQPIASGNSLIFVVPKALSSDTIQGVADNIDWYANNAPNFNPIPPLIFACRVAGNWFTNGQLN